MQRNKQTRAQKNLEPADYVISAGIVAPLIFDMIAWRKGWKTASIRFGEFLEDPKTRVLFVIFWGGITLHLFMKLPLPFQTKLKLLIIKEDKHP